VLADGRTMRGEATPERLRVLHVINQVSARAGAEISLVESILGSDGLSIDNAVVVLNPTGHVAGALEAHHIPVFVPERKLGRIGSIRHTREAIRIFRPHLVHSSLFEADLAARIAGFAAASPVITSVVNTPYGIEAVANEPVTPSKHRAVKFIDAFLARHATSAFHAISEATAAHAVQHLRVPRSRIRVVPRGRSVASLGRRTPERRQRLRRQQGWGDRPVILNVARQEPQKGHPELLTAMQYVLGVRPEALLILVGREGRSTPRIRELIRELGLTASVEQLGVRTDIPDLLAAADVFAFSSLWEGLGGAAVEAAGAALPLVAFELPAIREIVGPDHPWLVEVGDAEALGAMILEVLGADPVSTAVVAAAQRQRFLERYELDAAIRGMTELYRDVYATVHLHRRGWLHRVPRVRSLP
jgi:glycosyltransferase involved in cell wall biosynthesis